MDDDLRVWRDTDAGLELVAGNPLESTESPPKISGNGTQSENLSAIPDNPDYYYQCRSDKEDRELGRLLAGLLDGERDTITVVDHLAHRDEEIDLLYRISEVLGRTISLEEAATVIVREVSTVVGVSRASIMVHDPDAETLRPVAGWGVDVSEFSPVSLDDTNSVAVAAFRKGDAVRGNSDDPTIPRDPDAESRLYRSRAFLSVPIVYPDVDGRSRPVGVINLTDRIGKDAFESEHTKLLTAIAHQIGAAIENARLVALDRQQQRMRRELELAHDLQRRLLPEPTILGGEVDVGVQFRPAETVGGDFYQFVRLPDREVGVMLGDVSSHGFSAALIMAMVLSAAGIHAPVAESPEIALRRLLASLEADLVESEMHLSLFYGVLDSERGRLRYANAGHPHAFCVREGSPPERLDATAPPLGLADDDSISGRDVSWKPGSDLLLLFSDGIAESVDESGVVFGEARVLEIVQAQRTGSAQQIVDAIVRELERFSSIQSDDRTIVVVKA